MQRSLTTLIVALASGFANAEPEHTEKGYADASKSEHPEPGAKQAAPVYKSLEQLLPDEQKPALWIGSDAPALQLAHFPRGEPINAFETGHIYVVEMWATWCGPCIAAFPHVAELQETYKDDVTIIGVNIFEQGEGDERIELIDAFVEKHTEMKYTVAIEEGTAMADTWMKPSGRNGIPSAFIVDRAGKVAWMGHPMAMDEPLDQIVKGTYDIEAATRKRWLGHLSSVAWDKMLIAAHEGETERLLEVCKTLVYDAYSEGALPLNDISWRLLNYEGATPSMYRVARDAAHKACELTDWQDWMILDTYALSAHKTCDTQAAIKWQRKAIELAPDEHKAELRPQLDVYTNAG